MALTFIYMITIVVEVKILTLSVSRSFSNGCG